MALDGLLLHQVQKELQSFLPAKLTKLQQISDTELLFTIRTPKGTRRLMISLHSVYNRINLTQESRSAAILALFFYLLDNGNGESGSFTCSGLRAT